MFLGAPLLQGGDHVSKQKVCIQDQLQFLFGSHDLVGMVSFFLCLELPHKISEGPNQGMQTLGSFEQLKLAQK